MSPPFALREPSAGTYNAPVTHGTPLRILALAWLALASCGRAPEAPAPGVILISLDTLRADHLGLYGYARDTSPRLDALGRESLVFERAFTTAAWTLPAHMSMLTGLHNHQHGVIGLNAALAPGSPLLAERLKAAGWQTIGLYNESPIRPEHGFGRGFDVFRSHVGARQAGEHLAELLPKIDRSRPFFLFLHLFDIHNGPLDDVPGPIYDCPPPYDQRYLADARDRLPPISERELFERGEVDAATVEALTALYDGGIRHVDDTLAVWFEDWRARGLLEDTLLIVTADHGEALGQRGQAKGHGAPYQEGLRIPLILHHPAGLRAGEREPTPVQLTDLVPTILDFAGLPPDPRLPGVSLLGPVPAERPLLLLEPRNYDVVIDWPLKRTHLLHAGAERFFTHDLAADPAELAPLELDPAEFTRRRDAARERFGLGHPRPVRAQWTEAELDQMNALGYGGKRDEAEDEPANGDADPGG